MAITIRNKETEALIRRIGLRTGEGPSAVIRRLAENENRQAGPTVSQEEFDRRIAEFEEMARRYPPPDPKPTFAEVMRERAALYDYLDEETGASGSRKTP